MISGQILLYFYYLQRTRPEILANWMVDFNIYNNTGTKKTESEIGKALSFISNSDLDIFNSLKYLIEKGYISTGKESKTLDGNETIFDIKLTASGIDIIEGIERGNDEKKIFNLTFNINVENNMNIEGLIKAELGSILKGLLF